MLCSDSSTVLLSFHELPFHLAASPFRNGVAECLWPAQSQKLVLFSHTTTNRGKKNKPDQGKNQRQSKKLSHYMQSLTRSTCFFISLAGLFLVKKGICRTCNSDSTFYSWQKRSELEQCYATTITLFGNSMAEEKITSVRICFLLYDATTPDVINKGIFKAKLSLTFNSDLLVLYLSHQGQIKCMGQCHFRIICSRLAQMSPPTVSQHCNN